MSDWAQIVMVGVEDKQPCSKRPGGGRDEWW